MKVFVSYSHKDSIFADKLVQDLNYSDIKATYDKWLLKIGDSIIQKISEFVSKADKVVVILSKHSINSNWVQKELAIAMTGEIDGMDIKVLPVVIDDIKIPPMLSDKLYANFTWEYFGPFRELINSIDSNIIDNNEQYYNKRSRKEDKLINLKQLISSGKVEKIKAMLIKNDFFLATLLGRLWEVNEAIPNFTFKSFNKPIDFVVVNGQSFYYELALTSLLGVNFTDDSFQILDNEIRRLKEILATCYEFEKDFKTKVAIGMKDSYGANQIGEQIKEYKYPLLLKIKIINGRRDELNSEINNLRSSIYRNSNETIEIITYDRLIKSIEKSFHL